MSDEINWPGEDVKITKETLDNLYTEEEKEELDTLCDALGILLKNWEDDMKKPENKDFYEFMKATWCTKDK